MLINPNQFDKFFTPDTDREGLRARNLSSALLWGNLVLSTSSIIRTRIWTVLMETEDWRSLYLVVRPRVKECL